VEQRKESKFAEANTTLQSFIDRHPKHQLVTTAQMAIAANFDSLGRPDDALETYRRIAADHAQSFNAPMAMISQVPLLKAKGQIDDARRVCETVMTQYRDSFAAQEAQRYLKTLKPATNAAAPPAAPSPAAAPASAPAAAPTP
jgi:TolA-binding protein